MTEVLTAVTGYLRENPPAPGPSGAPGRDGEDGEDGRDGVDGQDGAPGQDGPPPSDEQIRAAVEAYLQSHPLNCPAGTSMDRMTVVTTGGPREVVVCTPQ
jgi:hypothetical protein